ncbi:hypothetical protein [Virgibacillus ainsalahensis]
MPWEIRQILLVVHIFLAVLWVGGVLFVGWGVFPAVRILAYEIQRKFFLTLMHWTHWFFTALGSGVILTGILLGTVAGPISNWDDVLNTTYGNTWFTALIVGIITLLWGVVVGYRHSIKIFSDIWLWKNAESGNKKPLTMALMQIAAVESVEVIGFITLIYLMVSL